MATTAADLLRTFNQTDEMREADHRIRNSTPATEPENWTFLGSMGWVYTGKDRFKTTATKKATHLNSFTGGPAHDRRRQYTTGTLGWHRGGDLLELAGAGDGAGFGNFSRDSWARLREATGSNYHPLIDTNPADHKAILELYKQEDYNPYAGVSSEGYTNDARKGSVADVLYGLMKDDYKNRYSVYNATRNLKNMGSTRMSSQIWNDSGLNNILGDYSERTGGGISAFDYIRNGDGMMGALSNFKKINNVPPKVNSRAAAENRKTRTGTWGAGHGLFSEENSAMRSLIADNLEKKLLG